MTSSSCPAVQPSAHTPGPSVPAPRPPLRRAIRGRWLSGVCAGLGEHLSVRPAVVRAVVIALALLGGIGVVGYIFLWVTVRQAEHPAYVPVEERTNTVRSLILLAAIGAALIGLAVIGAAEGAGPDWRPEVVIPIVIMAAGAIFFWSQLDDSTPGGLGSGRSRWSVIGRLAIALALIGGGLVGLTARSTGWTEVWKVAAAALIVIVGVVMLALPWAIRLVGDLRQEQAERIRATERADIAAHLHDSVLQTLALIQRRPGDPQMVARLARAQERQLRSWLYDDHGAETTTLASALAAAVEEVEDLHGVAVELVTTGDTALTDATEPLVRAVREAVWNAVRHAEPPISAYVEIGNRAVEAFVRDRGPGFDLDDIPEDRAGVRQSIIGRMERHGGTARIRRLEQGTEIVLTLPLDNGNESTKEAR